MMTKDASLSPGANQIVPFQPIPTAHQADDEGGDPFARWYWYSPQLWWWRSWQTRLAEPAHRHSWQSSVMPLCRWPTASLYWQWLDQCQRVCLQQQRLVRTLTQQGLPLWMRIGSSGLTSGFKSWRAW